MFVWWKKIEFYKGKCDCQAITIAAWGLGHNPCRVSRGKTPKIALLFNVFNAIKWLTTALIKSIFTG